MTVRLAILVLLAAILSVAPPAFAQLVADPNDRLYADLQLWDARGLVNSLPPLGPYPIQLVRRLLEWVQVDGDEQDKIRAARYLAHLQGILNLDAAAAAHVRSDWKTLYQQYGLGLAFQGLLRPNITYSGELGAAAAASNGKVDSLLPRYQRPVTNVVYDGSVVPLGTSGLTPRISTGAGASFGDDSLYFQGGIQHVSFGPFWRDNVVLSPIAPQAGQFSLVAVIEKTFQIGLSVDVYLETQYGTFRGNSGYTFEYVNNANFATTDVINNYLTLGVGYSY